MRKNAEKYLKIFNDMQKIEEISKNSKIYEIIFT